MDKKENLGWSTLMFIVGTILIFITIYALWARIASASIIPNQENFSTQGNADIGQNNEVFLQQLGSGYTGYIDTLTIKFVRTVNNVPTNGSFIVSLDSINNTDSTGISSYNNQTIPVNVTNYPTLTNEANFTFTGSTNNGTYTLTATTTLTALNENKTYFLRIGSGANMGGGSVVYYLGIPSSWSYGSFNSGDTAIGAMYMLWSGLDIPATSTVSHIVVPYINPTNADLEASTTVSFQYNYISADPTLQYATIEVRNLTDQMEYTAPSDPVLANGSLSYNHSLTLDANRFYMWRAVLRSTEGFIYGGWSTFDVLTYSGGFDEYIDPNTGLPLYATSTNFFDFLNVPNLLRTKAPTGYIYQIGSILSGLNDIAATSTPIYTVNVKIGSSATTSVEFFSIDTITELMPSWFITAMRALLVGILYASVILHLVRHSHNMFS